LPKCQLYKVLTLIERVHMKLTLSAKVKLRFYLGQRISFARNSFGYVGRIHGAAFLGDFLDIAVDG
jgi:hypothetical protein